MCVVVTELAVSISKTTLDFRSSIIRKGLQRVFEVLLETLEYCVHSRQHRTLSQQHVSSCMSEQL